MAKRVLTLSAGISDATTQRAIRQLEDTANGLTREITVTGAKGGNTALASLISALAQLGLITDKTN